MSALIILAFIIFFVFSISDGKKKPAKTKRKFPPMKPSAKMPTTVEKSVPPKAKTYDYMIKMPKSKAKVILPKNPGQSASTVSTTSSAPAATRHQPALSKTYIKHNIPEYTLSTSSSPLLQNEITAKPSLPINKSVLQQAIVYSEILNVPKCAKYLNLYRRN